MELIILKIKQIKPDLLPDEACVLDSVKQAHVSGKLKSDLLEVLDLNNGPEAILSVGQNILDIEYNPLWRMALRSASPEVLIHKWLRFENFAHSKNRMQIKVQKDNTAKFERYATHGSQPTRRENLLMCGIMIALLDKIGCKNTRCFMGDGAADTYEIYRNGMFLIPDDMEKLDTTSWTVIWDSFQQREITDNVKDAYPSMERLGLSRNSHPELLNQILLILASDTTRLWKIEELAREAGLSKRSLQRKLMDTGLTFSNLIRLVRIDEACRLLKDTDLSMTAICFCAGFSDSAQFSKDFGASMGMRPTDYRNVWRKEENS